MKKPTKADLFLEELTVLETELQAGRGDFKKIESLISSLLPLDSADLVDEYRAKVCPRLVPFLTLLIQEIERQKAASLPFYTADMLIMRIFVLFGYQPGLQIIADLIQKGYKKSDCFWSTALNCIETREVGDTIVRRLNGKLPDDFLGVLYLDMLNEICSKDRPYQPHPFASPQGIARLKEYIANPNKEKFSYAVSATTALAFLPEEIWHELLPLAFRHPSDLVRITAAYSGARLGLEQYRNALIDFAKDCRYYCEAAEYLEKLGLKELLPPATQTEEFAALAEMSDWLAFPSEFGAYPTDISIVDQRTLFWPPTQDKRTLTIIRYRYKDWNEDGSDEIGIGFVGSTTFSLSSIDLNQRSPQEIYAVYCAWEMGLEKMDLDEKNFNQYLAVGLKKLKKFNPEFDS